MRRIWPVFSGVLVLWALIYLVYAQWTALVVKAERENTPADREEVVEIRWFVGLGIGTSREQIMAEEQLVADFNATHKDIELVLEVITIGGAYDLFSTQLATGYFPDVIGPVSLGEANPFHRQWLSLTPFIEKTGFDTTRFPSDFMDFYKTETGLVSLPYAVSPRAIYYNQA